MRRQTLLVAGATCLVLAACGGPSLRSEVVAPSPTSSTSASVVDDGAVHQQSTSEENLELIEPIVVGGDEPMSYGPPQRMVLNSDGTLLATSTWTDVFVLEMASAEVLHHFEPDESTFGIAFSPDSTQLATWGGYGTTIYDVDSGEVVDSYSGYNANRVFYSGDQWLKFDTNNSYSGDERPERLDVYPLGASEPLFTVDPFDPFWNVVDAGPNGVLLSTDTGIAIHDIETGALHASTEIGSRTTDLDWNNTGTLVIFTAADSVGTWDPATGEVNVLSRSSGERDDEYESVCVSGEGRVIAGKNSGELEVWDEVTQDGPTTVQIYSQAVMGLACSSDGSRFMARSWHAMSLVETAPLGLTHDLWVHPGSVVDVGFSPDGQRVALAGQDGRLTIWDNRFTEKLVEIAAHQGSTYEVAFLSEDTVISAGDDDMVRLWNADTGAELTSYSGRDSTFIVRPGYSTAAVRQDNKITMVGPDGASGEVLSFVWSLDSYAPLAFSADGSRLALAADDTIYVWDIESGELLLGHKHESRPSRLAVNTDGTQFAYVDWLLELHVVDIDSGEVLLTREAHHDRLVYLSESELLADTMLLNVALGMTTDISDVGGWAYDYDAEQKTLILGDSFVGTIEIWNSEVETAVARFDDLHTDYVVAIAVSPNGDVAISASADGTVAVIPIN